MCNIHISLLESDNGITEGLLGSGHYVSSITACYVTRILGVEQCCYIIRGIKGLKHGPLPVSWSAQP